MTERTPKEILFAYGDKNDFTAHPWWAIAQRVEIGKLTGDYVVLAGPFFSRQSATDQLEARRHHYGHKAIVHCFSGNESRDYVELRQAVSGQEHPR